MAKLDREERELLASVERGEWRSAADHKSALRQYVRAARRALRKDKRVNIRLSQTDLDGLRVRAVEEGLPYQTLISSVLHKYVTGHLVTSKS